MKRMSETMRQKLIMIEGLVERITRDEIVKAIGSLKTRKAPGPIRGEH